MVALEGAVVSEGGGAPPEPGRGLIEAGAFTPNLKHRVRLGQPWSMAEARLRGGAAAGKREAGRRRRLKKIRRLVCHCLLLKD